MGGQAFERDARRSPTLQTADGGSRCRRSGRDRTLAETSPQARAPGLATDVDEELAGATPAPVRWTFSRCHAQIMEKRAYGAMHPGSARESTLCARESTLAGESTLSAAR